MNFIALPRGFSVLLLQHGPSQRFPSPAGRGLKVRDLIQRASSRARLKILSPLRFCPDVCDQKTIFDGTKLPVDGSRPKTTTYGMNLLFSRDLDDSKLRHFAA